MISIKVDKPFLAMIKPEILEQAALTTYQHQAIPVDSGLSIVVTDDLQMQQLNLQFIGIDAPTDVLSFPAGYTDPDTESLYLGDILISYPQAHKQAEKAGHPVEAELQLLAVHGVLHLAGHDHDDDQDKANMWDAQAEILSILGVRIQNLPE